MQVALFRPNKRQEWVERLRKSGYEIKFVHDSDRITAAIDIVVVDAAVGKWKDYVRLVQEKGVPIVLLVANTEHWETDKLTALGVAGAVTMEEETNDLFDRFLQQNHPADEAGLEPSIPFPRWGGSLVLTNGENPISRGTVPADDVREAVDEPELAPIESGMETERQQDAAPAVPLSQRKAVRHKSKEMSSALVAPIATKDIGCNPDETQKRINGFPESFYSEDRDQGQSDRPVENLLLIEVAELSDGEEESEEQRTVTQSSPSAAHPKNSELPSIVAVYAAKGGVGKTTFLLQLAASLAKEGCRICVLDLDLMHGTVASTLQVKPNKTIVDLLHRIDDSKASRACLLHMKMGFFIVAAPLQPGSFRMEGHQLLSILRFLKEEMEVVLIDTPTYFDALIKLTLEQVDQIMLMTTDEPASMLNLSRMKPLLSSLLPAPDMVTVWNRFTAPVPKEQWKGQLPWPTILELPEDETINRAVRSGQFIASSPCSPYRLRMKELVDRWMGVEPDRPDRKRNLLTRLLSSRI